MKCFNFAVELAILGSNNMILRIKSIWERQNITWEQEMKLSCSFIFIILLQSSGLFNLLVSWKHVCEAEGLRTFMYGTQDCQGVLKSITSDTFSPN